jgi:predicted DNA-binding transcriptional regulator YafY
MNRTDRLYAMVEQLRAGAPRAVTSRQLADRFEVSVRTIERDITALQQAGVPIWATPGPGGGYSIDPSMTLPPVNFTAHEALAVAVALSRAGTIPFARSARMALQKLVAAMSADAAGQARELAERIRLFLPDGGGPRALAPEVEQAVLDGEVVTIDYEDRTGTTTTRTIEPAGFVGDAEHWYLVAWCRLRGDGRSFRLDRIRSFRPTGELAPARPFDTVSSNLPDVVRRTPLSE